MADENDSHLWQRMATEEMRREARARGIRLSELEEERAMQAAMQESTSIVVNASITTGTTSSTLGIINEHVSNKDEGPVEFDEEQPDCDHHLPHDNDGINVAFSPATMLSSTNSELSIWQTHLPSEITVKILQLLLDPDMCGYLSCVAKTNPFKPNEAVYKAMCEKIYTNQTRKKQLVVENWVSWRNMLIFRPRLRTNGFYCLRTLFTRAPCHDNFWEEKKVQSVECKFYRYMRFLENGKMLYSLEVVEPELLAKHLKRGVGMPKKIFEGTYSVCRREVCVEVEMHYAMVYFKLQIMNSEDGFEGSFNTLRILEHASAAILGGGRRSHPAPTAAPTTLAGPGPVPPPGMVPYGAERIGHKLPSNCDMQFWRYWNWTSVASSAAASATAPGAGAGPGAGTAAASTSHATGSGAAGAGPCPSPASSAVSS